MNNVFRKMNNCVCSWPDWITKIDKLLNKKFQNKRCLQCILFWSCMVKESTSSLEGQKTRFTRHGSTNKSSKYLLSSARLTSCTTFWTRTLSWRTLNNSWRNAGNIGVMRPKTVRRLSNQKNRASNTDLWLLPRMSTEVSWYSPKIY